jgi:polyphosphate kinase
MERNLDKRIEVGCPIYDQAIQAQVSKIFKMQWQGNVKSRIVDENQANSYFREGEKVFESQKELHEHYKLS